MLYGYCNIDLSLPFLYNNYEIKQRLLWFIEQKTMFKYLQNHF